ncbi:hypothetical protein FKM82_024918 [Ascaphus truei]
MSPIDGPRRKQNKGGSRKNFPILSSLAKTCQLSLMPRCMHGDAVLNVLITLNLELFDCSPSSVLVRSEFSHLITRSSASLTSTGL